MAADSEAYIPGYRHDIFVSYAWGDDRPQDETQYDRGWVRTTIEHLRHQLIMRLGRESWGGQLWDDSRIPSGRSITPEVIDAVRGSAFLLVVLSECWLNSPWCQEELNTFVETLGCDYVDGHIFVLRTARIEPERCPEAIRDLKGVDLFTESGNGVGKMLGFPVPLVKEPSDRDYFNRIIDLSHDIAERMRGLREAMGAPAAQASVPVALCNLRERNLTHRLGERRVASEETAPNAVYIAEGSPDLRRNRDLLMRQLKQCGIPVRPIALLPAASDAFIAAAQRELQQSLLFVQLLGPYVLDKRPDMPESYEEIQLRLAKEAGLPVLRWMDPGIDQQALDAHGQRLFEAHEVVISGFDDFKRRVETSMQRILTPLPRRSLSGPDCHVLIRAAEVDEDTAHAIGEQLWRQGLGSDISNERTPLEDLVRQAPFHGLLVVYDRCDREWAEAQLRKCRVIAQTAGGRNAAIGVLDADRVGKRELGTRIPRFHRFTALEDPGFAGFMQAVARGCA